MELLIKTDGGFQIIPHQPSKAQETSKISNPRLENFGTVMPRRKFLRFCLSAGMSLLVTEMLTGCSIAPLEIKKEDILDFILTNGFPKPKGEPQSDDPNVINPDMTKPDKRFFAGKVPVYRFEDGNSVSNGMVGENQKDLETIKKEKTLTITVHGNGMAANKSHEEISKKTSKDNNHTTIAIELPGHGARFKDESMPRQRTTGVLEAVSYAEALEKILEQYEDKDALISLYSVSLGASATMHALMLLKAKGIDISRFRLFLESPVVSMSEALRGTKPKQLNFLSDSTWQSMIDNNLTGINGVELKYYIQAYNSFIVSKPLDGSKFTYDDYQKSIAEILKEVKIYIVASEKDDRLRYSKIKEFVDKLKSKKVDIALEPINADARHGELGIDAGSEFDQKWNSFVNQYLGK